eukprot:TRINITY_DN14878_c0_g1_i1.p1 TRINITY_DN14878_c0_g1~~TRINITY_DN14878_c0_g1_i1.p1  ORF type:complete len:323 (-),score=105.84 TRINITY_DN14878_c0_g1_i1:187-1155(-)
MALLKMQSLVDAAGEALGLIEDPLLTPVGIKIEEATNEALEKEDIELNMEICEIVNDTENVLGPEQAIRAIKRKIQNSLGKSTTCILLTLALLETLVKNCGEGFVFIVCQREFGDFLLYLVTTPGIELDKVIQDRVLALIQSWALAYSSDKKLRGVAEVYMILKDKGIKFPEPSDEDLKDTEEIEAFLKELEEEIDQIGEFEEEIYDEEVNGEEVTTDEFDRFLKKRVEAATKKETEEIAFSSDHDLKGIAEVYEVLKEKGIEIPMPSEEDLEETDEIEHWMKEHEGETELNDSDEENNLGDATTDDFNKFLEKRIEAVQDD